MTEDVASPPIEREFRHPDMAVPPQCRAGRQEACSFSMPRIDITRDIQATHRRYAATRSERDLEALVLRYRGLCRALARRYARPPLALDDLEQVACEGLVKALHRFDPDRGSAFPTFAVPSILGELRRFCRESLWPVHVPRPVQERVRRIRQIADELSRSGRRAPTVREIVAASGCHEDDVADALIAMRCLQPLSIDAPQPNDDWTPVVDGPWLRHEEPGYAAVENAAAIEAAALRLTALEREVIRLRFGEDLSRRRIAARLGIPESHAENVLTSALETMEGVAA
jgi:RNA polymerase sigma-B factor